MRPEKVTIWYNYTNNEKVLDRPTVSDETRLRQRNSAIGRKASKETKEKISKATSGENHPFFGKKHSEESKAKMSLANSGENHPKWGTKHSEETRAKMSAKAVERYSTQEARQFAREQNLGSKNPMHGKKHSESTRAQMSAARKGVKQELVSCPHCTKVGGKANMNRWHFDNCKLKEII